MVSPNACRVVTELMPTWRNLWAQRLRWQRGALENLGAYGLAPTMLRLLGPTARHRLRGHRTQFILAAHLVTALAAGGGFGSVLARRRKPVRRRKGRHRLARRMEGAFARALLIPELIYDIYVGIVYVKGIFDITFARAPDGVMLSTRATHARD